jgi:hypothetical protein
MLIQFILIAIIAIIIWRLTLQWRAKEIPTKQFNGWLLIWLLALAVVIWPDLTVWVANLVGIGRGADLVVYLAVIFIVYFLFRLLLRIEKIEKNLTKLVRNESLKDYEREIK